MDSRTNITSYTIKFTRFGDDVMHDNFGNDLALRSKERNFLIGYQGMIRVIVKFFQKQTQGSTL